MPENVLQEVRNQSRRIHFSRMEANTDPFYLTVLEYCLLKHNGCQLATAEKWGFLLTSQQYLEYITLNHNYKKKNKIFSDFLWISGSLKHNNFVWKIFIHSNEVHIRDALGIIPYNFFSDIY